MLTEQLYLKVEGPNGTAEVFEVPVNTRPDRWASEGWESRRQGDAVFQVRFKDQRLDFWQEGEAATVACELAGVPFGMEYTQRAPGRRRGISLRQEWHRSQ